MKSIMTVGCKDIIFAVDLSVGDLKSWENTE